MFVASRSFDEGGCRNCWLSLSDSEEWVAWYRQGGVAEVRRHRYGGHGGKQPSLTLEQEAALKAKATAGEIRTIWEAVEWAEKGFGVEYSYWGMRWVFARLSAFYQNRW